MKNSYYVIRKFRNGRALGGYDLGRPARFASLDEAEQNAAAFAADVLPTCSADKIVVGVGALRAGRPVGSGHRIAEYRIPSLTIGGEVARYAYDQ